MADFCKKCAPKKGMKFEGNYPFLCEECGKVFYKPMFWAWVTSLFK